MKPFRLAHFLPFLFSLSLLSLVEADTETKPISDVVLIAVAQSPQPDNAKVVILSPIEGETKALNPVKIQVEVQGLSLGSHSELSRENEVSHEDGLQELRVIVDNYSSFSIYQQVVGNTAQDPALPMDQHIEFDVPFTLEPGMHIVRIFPVQSFQEGMKGSDVFATRFFYLKTFKNNPEFDLTKPYLTYNQPQGKFEYKIDQPLLLDFYVSNCTLSPDGYKVLVTIDNSFTETLTDWTPYYMYGLKKGAHKITLELLDADNKRVPGELNHVQRVVSLY